MIRPFPKPLSAFHPKPERLPERKQMTIAIGITAQDGIVIAADSQESTGDYMKGAKGKISCFYSQDGKEGTFGGDSVDSLVVSGAGDSGYVRALGDELGKVFLTHPKLPVHAMPAFADSVKETINLKFESCLATFYKKHIIPFGSFPERKRPDVEMLFGVQRKTIRALFTTEKTVINPAMPCKAIGWGSTFAELFLNKLWRGMSIEQAELLAAYVIFLTKESVETCGKFTTIVTIRGPKIIEDAAVGSRMLPTEKAMWLKRELIEEWEHSFRNRWQESEQNSLFSLIDSELSKHSSMPSTSRKSKGRR